MKKIKKVVVPQSGRISQGVIEALLNGQKNIDKITVVRINSNLTQYIGQGNIPVTVLPIKFTMENHFVEHQNNSNIRAPVLDNDRANQVIIYYSDDQLEQYINEADIIICSRGIKGVESILSILEKLTHCEKKVYFLENDYTQIDNFIKQFSPMKLEIVKCCVDYIVTDISYKVNEITVNADKKGYLLVNEKEEDSIFHSNEYINVIHLKDRKIFEVFYNRKIKCMNYTHFYLSCLVLSKAKKQGLDIKEVSNISELIDEDITSKLDCCEFILFSTWLIDYFDELRSYFGNNNLLVRCIKEYFQYYQFCYNRMKTKVDSPKRILKYNYRDIFMMKNEKMNFAKMIYKSKYIGNSEKRQSIANMVSDIANFPRHIELSYTETVRKELLEITQTLLNIE